MSAPMPFRFSRRLSRKLSNAVSSTLRDLRYGRGESEGLRRAGGLEQLEERRLFTTLVGGDSFEFLAPDPANPGTLITNRIVLTGNIVAELVGGTLNNATNTVTLSDVPGAFNQSAIRGLTNFTYNPTDPFLGGVGGGSGVQAVAANGGLSITDPLNQNGNVPWLGGSATGNPAFTMSALATDATNTTYGFNVVRSAALGTAGETAIIQLVKLGTDGQTGTVVADIESKINAVTPLSNFINANGVTQVTAAAFDPVSGRLYFVVRGATSGVAVAGTVTSFPITQQLFSLKIGTSNAATNASIQAVAGSFQQTVNNNTVVTALAFDQTSATTRTCYGYIVGNVGSGSVNTGTLFQVNLNNTDNINNGRAITYGVNNTPLTAITGLAFVNDNKTAAETTIYAIESATGNLPAGASATLAVSTTSPQIMTISLANGNVTLLGTLPNPSSTVAPILGANLQDLTYNPTLRNPFTGQLGVLVSVDDFTDQFVYVDSRDRFPGVAAFSLYIAQSDANATITWGIVPNIDLTNATTANAERDMEPFTGSAGTFEVYGQSKVITSPGNIGGVFLGTKTSGNSTATLNNIPIIASQLSKAMGVAPAGISTTGIVSSQSLLAALTTSESISQRLIGNAAISDVTSLAVTSAGTVYAIDSSFVNAAGQNVNYNKVAVIDPTTGKIIGNPIAITTPSGSLLSTNEGAVTTQNDQILAIFLQQATSSSTGSVNGGINFAAANQSPISLTIAGSGTNGYILAQQTNTVVTQGVTSNYTTNFLYSYTLTSTANGTSFAYTPLGTVADANGNTITQAAALGLNASGQLYTVGFNSGNPNPTQSTGGSTVSTAGTTPEGLTYAADGNIYLLSSTTTGLVVQQVQRNLTTGAVTGLGAPTSININGTGVQNLNALTGASGTLVGIGSSQTSLSPTVPSGNLTDQDNASNFIYRGLAKIGATGTGAYFAVTTNGSTFILRGVSSTAAGTVVAGAFNPISGTAESTRQAGAIPLDDIRYTSATGTTVDATAIVNINAIAHNPLDPSAVYTVAFGADQFIPTVSTINNPVVGQLTQPNYTAITVEQYTTFERFDDSFTTVPTTQNNVLDAGATPALINDSVVSSAYLASAGLSATLNPGVTYSLPYIFSQYDSATRDTASGGISSAGGAGSSTMIVGQNSGAPTPIPIDGQPIQALNGTNGAFGALSFYNATANGIVQTVALGSATNKNGTQTALYTSGFDYDAPVPAAPVAGNLGNAFGSDATSHESNVRALAFSYYPATSTVAPALETGYALVLNNQGGVDLYQLLRNAKTGGVQSFTRISTDPRGLLDPVTKTPINFVYTMTADTTNPNSFYFIGSPTPGQGSANMFLYNLVIGGTTANPTVTVSLPGGGINLTQEANAVSGAWTLAGVNPGQLFKASAMDLEGQNLYVVLDNNGSTSNGVGNPTALSSILLQIPLASGVPTTTMNYIGAMGGLTYAANLTLTGNPIPVQSVNNSNIRAMQFHFATDGSEKLLAIDTAGDMMEFDLNNATDFWKAVPMAGTVDDGGNPNGTFSGVTGTFDAVVGVQVNLPGTLSTSISTFAIDQYGRSFSVVPASSATPGSADYLYTSPNELFEYDTTDQNNNGWSDESIRLGWLLNADGTAFTDTITNITNDKRDGQLISGPNVANPTANQTGLVVTFRNIYMSSEHPLAQHTVDGVQKSLVNVDRLATIAFPAGAGTTTNPTINVTSAFFYVNPVVPTGQSTTAPDAGQITINGNASTLQTGEQINVVSNGAVPDGTQSNIRGLAWIQGSNGRYSLIGLNVGGGATGTSVATGSANNFVSGGQPQLVAFNLNTDHTLSAAQTASLNDPTYSTLTLTDPTDTAWTTQNPAGLAVDAIGRYYTIDNSYADPLLGTTYAALEGSPNRASIFGISVTTGDVAVNSSKFSLNHGQVVYELDEQLDPSGQSTPNGLSLTPFSAIAFYLDSSNNLFAYIVQRDTRVVDAFGNPTPLDRLVKVTFSQATNNATGTALALNYYRVNASAFGGQIQIGNTLAPGSGVTPNGQATNITAMDFTSGGLLIALDNGLDVNGNQTGSNALIQVLNLGTTGTTSDTLAPTDAILVTGSNTAQGLAGLTITGTSVASIDTTTNPDRLLRSQNNLEVYGVTPGGATTDNGAVTVNGANLTDDFPVTAIATQPGTGLLYFIVRALDTNSQPADFLYTLNPNTNKATALGQIQLTTDAGGNTQTATNTDILAIDFGASGQLLAVSNATPGSGNGRQLISISMNTPGASSVVPGSTPGSVSASAVGFTSDQNNASTNAVPSVDRGRFYTLDVSTPGNSILRVTPSNEYLFASGNGTIAKFNSQGAVGVAGGLALLDTISSLAFSNANTPGGANVLYGTRNPLALTSPQVSRLVSFPTSQTTVAGLNEFVLGGGTQIVVTGTNPFLGNTVQPIANSQNALVSSFVFLPDGSIRALDQGQGAQRLIDFTVTNPGAAIARTDPGAIDSSYVGLALDANSNFYTIDTSQNPSPLLVQFGTGLFTPPTLPSAVNNALGSPVLGTLTVNATGATPSAVFTPVTGTVPTFPGRLPTSITEVKAMAYDRYNTDTLWIVDQNNTLIQISPTTGAIIQTVGVIKDAITGATLNIGSMTFVPTTNASTGAITGTRLLAQDLSNSRMVDVSVTTAIAGLNAATAVGSLPNTVGAIAYDPIGKRILVADNATGVNTTTLGTSSEILQVNLGLTSAGQDIGKLFIGGTVTGQLSFSGSVGTFYAGWILTGTIDGLGVTAVNPTPGNFHVAGNLHDLVTAAPIGGTGVTFATTNNGVSSGYVTGTDITVAGRIGAIHSSSDILATIRATGTSIADGFTGGQTELADEAVAIAPQTQAALQGINFQAGLLNNPSLYNNTQATAQALYPALNADGSSSGTAIVNGILQNANPETNSIDFYSIPLMAGQKITLELTADVPPGAQVASAQLYFGVFDSDGRLVFSSHSLNGGAYPGGTFAYTAIRPGSYKIAVAQPDDTNFNGVVTDPLEGGGSIVADSYYTLTVGGLGNLTIGGVIANGSFLDHTPTLTTGNAFASSAIYAATGDIGSIFGGTGLFGEGSTTSDTVRADGGSIRAIIGGSIGRNVVLDASSGISISAAGNVGLISATAGPLVLNESVTPPGLTTYVGTKANFNPGLTKVGGSIQTIQSSGLFFGNIFANGSLGNLLVGSMASLTPSFISVNAAGTAGVSGTIDMIDCTGDFGSATGGGPVIYTNGGGNVRYLLVGGTTYRDAAFGGGPINTIFITPSSPLSFTDDSGSTLSVTFDSRTLADSTPQIGYLAYPVRSGGAVMMILQVSGLGSAATIPPGTAAVTLSSSGAGGAVDIGSLVFLSTNANPITITPPTVSATGVTSAATFSQSATNSYNVAIQGSAQVNIANLSVLNAAGAAVGDLQTITNGTGGELLSAQIGSVGTLAWSGSIGVAAASVTGVAVSTLAGSAVAAYPFQGLPFVVNIGDAGLISSSRAIGALLVGNVDTISAKASGVTLPGMFQGIVGPIYAQGDAAGAGIINTVNIGDGVLPAGSGNVGGGAIIAASTLGTVQGSGDVRGIIAAGTSIGSIAIGGTGALIGAIIAVYGNTLDGLAPINNDLVDNITPSGAAFPVLGATQTYQLGSLRVAGGIIGTEVTAYNINSISVRGFGIFASNILSGGGGLLGSLTAAGYGIRGVTVTGFTSIGAITATGNGSQLSAASITPSVRQSEYQTIDSYFGVPIGKFTDVDAYLSTSAATPIINGVTNTGIIQDLVANGNGRLGTITAWQIGGSVPGTTNSQLIFGSSIGTIKTTSLINGLTIKTGRITTFSPGSDVLALDLTLSGALSTFRINGNLGSNSVIDLQGPNAYLGNFYVAGNFDGSLLVAGRVGTIKIGGNLTTGTITITPIVPGGTSLGTLLLGGSLSGASLNVTGNIGKISVAGSLGSPGDTLTVNGSIGSLLVGTNRKIANKVLAMNVNVTGAINVISVNGRITGSITAAGNIGSVKVTTDGSANPVAISAPITSTAGSINAVSVVNGNLGANISAFNNIKSVSISNGSYNAGSAISTTNGSVGSVTVKGGNLLSSVVSGTPASGLRPISSISVTGQVGDGVNPVSIKGSALKSFKSGSLFSGTTINVAGAISSLTILGNVNAGSAINAGSISRRKITGAINGDITITG